jgi:flagellar hook-associated protein 3 FlgL
MTMRVTDRMMMDRTIRDIEENMGRLGVLREKASSMKNFQRASDDPSAASASLSLRSAIQSSQGYLDTAKTTGDWMTASENAMNHLLDLGAKALNEGLKGVSDTIDDKQRKILSDSIDTYLSQAVQAGNTQHAGNYIFSGTAVKTQTFTLTGSTLTSADDGKPINRFLGPGQQSITANLNGGAAIRPMLSALVQVRDALDTAAGPFNPGALDTALDALKNGIDTASKARSLNGSRLAQVNSTSTQLTDTQLTLNTMLNQKEDASMVEVITNLRHQETTYQTVLEVSGRTLATTNLFNYLG